MRLDEAAVRSAALRVRAAHADFHAALEGASVAELEDGPLRDAVADLSHELEDFANTASLEG